MLKEYNKQGKVNGRHTLEAAGQITQEFALNPHFDQAILTKPVDLPFYKCIQLPEHMKWINVHGVSKKK